MVFGIIWWGKWEYWTLEMLTKYIGQTSLVNEELFDSLIGYGGDDNYSIILYKATDQ